nr:MAG TPA: hypothetical protein [Caudoviricetes sp.]
MIKIEYLQHHQSIVFHRIIYPLLIHLEYLFLHLLLLQ